MSPKEKAEDLFNKFHKTCNATIAGASTLFRDIARNAAIIAVDEIIKASPCHDTLPDVTSYTYDEVKEAIRYWEEVKKELEKL